MGSATPLLSAVSTMLVAVLFIPVVDDFYLPGVAPQDFTKGDALQVMVNKFPSIKTQLLYDYYFLTYCKPEKIMNSAENLGEVLRSDRIENSVDSFKMRTDESCKSGCKTNYERGFLVRFRVSYSRRKEAKYFINNHLQFKVRYHKDVKTDSARIVDFEVTPYSVNHEYKQPWDDKNPQLITCGTDSKNIIHGRTVPQEVEADKEVIFTYDILDIKWASPGDTYLLMSDYLIHWFSIINSLMTVLFLSEIVAMIMMQTLYKDIANYNQLVTTARKSINQSSSLGQCYGNMQEAYQQMQNPLICQGTSSIQGLKELKDSTIQMAPSMGMMHGPVDESVFDVEKEINDLLPVEVKEQRLSNLMQAIVGGVAAMRCSSTDDEERRVPERFQDCSQWRLPDLPDTRNSLSSTVRSFHLEDKVNLKGGNDVTVG